MKKKKLMTADPNKNTILSKKEATSSASEDLMEMVFYPDHTITGLAP